MRSPPRSLSVRKGDRQVDESLTMHAPGDVGRHIERARQLSQSRLGRELPRGRGADQDGIGLVGDRGPGAPGESPGAVAPPEQRVRIQKQPHLLPPGRELVGR